MISVICGIYKKRKMYKSAYLHSRSRVTDTENKIIVTRTEGGRGINKETETDMYTVGTVYLLYRTRKLYSVLCNGLYGNRILKNSGYLYVFSWFTLLYTCSTIL